MEKFEKITENNKKKYIKGATVGFLLGASMGLYFAHEGNKKYLREALLGAAICGTTGIVIVWFKSGGKHTPYGDGAAE